MYNNKIVNQIVAVNNKGYIGKNDKLMWYNKEDLEHFKESTLLNALVVGRKTYDSLPKVVHQGRLLIPVSRSGLSVEDAMDKAAKYANKNTIFIIGGAEIYKETAKYTDFIVLSRINDDQEGDVKYEVPDGFILADTIQHETFTLEIWERIESELNLFFLANTAQDQEQVSTAFDYDIVEMVFDQHNLEEQ
jgi:dihydrofolate reductase